LHPGRFGVVKDLANIQVPVLETDLVMESDGQTLFGELRSPGRDPPPRSEALSALATKSARGRTVRALSTLQSALPTRRKCPAMSICVGGMDGGKYVRNPANPRQHSRTDGHRLRHLCVPVARSGRPLPPFAVYRVREAARRLIFIRPPERRTARAARIRHRGQRQRPVGAPRVR